MNINTFRLDKHFDWQAWWPILREVKALIIAVQWIAADWLMLTSSHFFFQPPASLAFLNSSSVLVFPLVPLWMCLPWPHSPLHSDKRHKGRAAKLATYIILCISTCLYIHSLHSSAADLTLFSCDMQMLEHTLLSRRCLWMVDRSECGCPRCSECTSFGHPALKCHNFCLTLQLSKLKLAKCLFMRPASGWPVA